MMPCKNIYFIHDDGTAELRCGDHCILLDVCDVDMVSEFQWSIGTHGYATSGCGEKQILLHRMVAGAKDGEMVDHINRNKMDNRRSNLRICSFRQNIMNREKLVSGNNPYKGVCRLSDGCWQAQIRCNNRAVYLGRFHDVCDAAKAYDAAARELFGEFAYLNFPNCTDYPRTHIKHHRKLSWDEAASIRYLYESGMSISELAKMYEHSYSAIQRIVHYRTFKEAKHG